MCRTIQRRPQLQLKNLLLAEPCLFQTSPMLKRSLAPPLDLDAKLSPVFFQRSHILGLVVRGGCAPS
jgi:hypothetical protein